MATFTRENQKGNDISRSTKQSLKHIRYSEIEITISGMSGEYSVWVKSGKRMSQRFSELNLDQAIIEANKLLTVEIV